MALIDWINLQGKRALRSLLRSSLSARCPSPLVLLRDCTADRSRCLAPSATRSCRGALHLIIFSIPSVGPNPLAWKLALEYMDIVLSWQYPVHDSSNGPCSDLSETLFGSVSKKATSLLNLKVCVAKGLFATFALTAVSFRPLTVLVPLEHSSEYLPHQVSAVMRRFGWKTARGLKRTGTRFWEFCVPVSSRIHQPASDRLQVHFNRLDWRRQTGREGWCVCSLKQDIAAVSSTCKRCVCHDCQLPPFS